VADVTVIVTTADRTEWLERSLRSVVATIEADSVETTVLVVDDSRTPGPAREVAAPQGANYAINPSHATTTNPSSARVFGLSLVKTPLFAFFDDDDVMLPGHLGLMKGHLDDGADLCATGHFVGLDRDDGLAPGRRVIPRQGRLGDLLAGWNSINDGSMMRTEAARKLRWDPAMANVMMYSVFVQALVEGWRVDRTAQPTFIYRQSTNSQSRTLDENDTQVRQAMLLHYRDIVRRRDGRVPAMHPTVALRRRVAFLIGRGV
jgi:glycosyltransferase involved in cell wall biosynthesis